MATMIAVDETEFRELVAEVRALRDELRGVTIMARPEWLTIPQAADALNVSASTIRRKIRTGEIEAKGEGKSRMVRL